MPASAPVFRSLDDLKGHLRTLPAPRPGWRRVFRGQNRDFGKMIPSGIRRRTREYWSLWHRHVMLVAPFESDLQIAEREGVPSTLDMLSYWVHAIAQHYGGDSNYLDVTGDLQSALWFALHQMNAKSGSVVLGTGTETDPLHDVVVKQTYWKYERWEGPAYLYVFDVPPWRGEASLAHGMLIDVSEQAPQLVGESARMTVQRACLLHADGDVGDLASFYACPPLQVNWPMLDADRLSLGTREIFPPPTVDPWYATFLQQPLTLAPSADGEVRFERPIPVALYLYDEPSERNDLAARLTLDQPPLARVGMRELLADGGAPSELVERLDAAATILCEAALQALLPGRGDHTWHAPLLLSDLPDSVDATQLDTGESAGHVDLTNVVFEFSPLEGTAAASAHRTRAADYVRALWVARDAGEIMVTPFVQRAEGPGVTMSPLKVTLDTSVAGGLAFAAGATRLPDAATRFLLAPVCAALFTLRSLASGDKILPFQLAALDAGLPSGSFVAGVDRATTRLCLAAGRPWGVSLFVLRQEGEVFFGPGRSTTRTFVMPATQPFGLVPTSELRRWASMGA